jgi:hypothetical protein
MTNRWRDNNSVESRFDILINDLMECVTPGILQAQLGPHLSLNMRAVLVDNNRQGAEKLYVGEAPTPKPNEGEVLVKVRFSTLIRVLIYGE